LTVLVERIMEKINTYMIWWRNLKERIHLEVHSVDGRIILKRILKEYGGFWRR